MTTVDVRGPEAGTDTAAAAAARSIALKRLGTNLFQVLISIVVTLALWWGFIYAFHVQSAVARSPLDVFRYLFTQHASSVHKLRSAAGNRKVLFHNLGITLEDASLGYLAGIVLGLGVACLFELWRLAEQTFMPIALTLRSVPLVAMAPVITLVFNRGHLAAAVVGGIVCFFPALVNIMYGLRSAPKSSLDLMASYGASKLTTLRKVLIPSAMPSIFASLRINVPAAMIGALLAEWIATGKGTGAEILLVLNTFDIGELWAAVALVTLVAVIAYSAVSVIEAAVLARYAPDVVGRKT